MRILIVEDEFKIADVIASRLKKENFKIIRRRTTKNSNSKKLIL